MEYFDGVPQQVSEFAGEVDDSTKYTEWYEHYFMANKVMAPKKKCTNKVRYHLAGKPSKLWITFPTQYGLNTVYTLTT